MKASGSGGRKGVESGDSSRHSDATHQGSEY